MGGQKMMAVQHQGLMQLCLNCNKATFFASDVRSEKFAAVTITITMYFGIVLQFIPVELRWSRSGGVMTPKHWKKAQRSLQVLTRTHIQYQKHTWSLRSFTSTVRFWLFIISNLILIFFFRLWQFGFRLFLNSTDNISLLATSFLVKTKGKNGPEKSCFSF